MNINRKDIKNIMIVFNDNDFIRAFDWVGKITLYTLKKKKNICNGKILQDTEDIESFVYSLLPTAIEFIQYREDKSTTRYNEINKSQLDYLCKYFNNVKFKYNFDETDVDWINGGSEILVIDLIKNKSFIR